MEYSLEERIHRYLRLAEVAAAEGRHRHARLFRQMALELSAPV
jgi:rubrerythrin